MPEPLILIDPIDDDDIAWVWDLMKLARFDAPRRQFLKTLSTIDVSACPGSGKTTLVVAKLAILARKWKSGTRGICVLSHTNTAREEIKHRLGNTVIGQRLLSYPHFIDTIHGFVNRFLAIPWLLSAGYQVSAIDNEITTGVRRRHLGERNYHRLSAYLDNKHKSFDGLRITSSDFTRPLSGGSFPGGPHTEMYQLAEATLRHAAEQGYFCFDEIFVLGEALLTLELSLPAFLSHRFPFVLVDEMQDTSEQQNAFLRRLFARTSDAVCVQRVGDPNQAIFEGGSAPTEDCFPDQQGDRCLSIPNSFRFGPSLAALASPLAFAPVQPAGLCGVGPRVVPGLEPGHTIFLFPDNDVSGVLDAFGRHVLGALPADVIRTAAVTAVGAVHKPYEDVGPSHAHYPKTVAHYWTGYQSGVAKKAYHPATLAEYFLAAQLIVRSGGPFHQCVNSVAFGITRLANLLADNSHLKARTRQHRLVEEKFSGSAELRALYRGLLTRFLADGEALTPQLWSELCPSLRSLAVSLGGGDANAASANHFLSWPARPTIPTAESSTDSGHAGPNTYRFREGDAFVDIRLSSLHLAKGQTHVATLLLETFNRTHFLNKLLPWLLGKRANGAQCSNGDSDRLFQAYVAMTRPTHLLCLAMRRSSLGTGGTLAANQEKLEARGWRIHPIAAT